MDLILHSSKLAILFNSISGRLIDCKRRMHQGDPLLPYMFLIVADVLEQTIIQDPLLLHPLLDDAPCLLLQYADDMVIIMQLASRQPLI
jgi:hypothetical protein